MFKRTAQDLGLDLVLNSISHYALSSLGSKAIIDAKPVTTEEAYVLRQKQVQAVIYALSAASAENGVRTEVFPDIKDVFERIALTPSGSLTGEQVYNVGLFIRSTRLLKELLNLSLQLSCPVKDSLVCEVIEDIPYELQELEKEVFKILESPGTVKESYPTVKALRDKADAKRMERSHLASDLMHKNWSIMQSDTAVLRDGRIVLPVKNESKSFVEGYVQSSSSSGGTVFMEPFRLVDMNNAVIMAQEEIQLEIARLIGKLSDMVRACEVTLRVLSSQVAKADFLYA
ncbi:MAG: hypothetical protein HUK23_06475, partial [Sphaerochaetaceae bacterium]|nr:hypothetical protein [Sphaerochaetaceae bacterium]